MTLLTYDLSYSQVLMSTYPQCMNSRVGYDTWVMIATCLQQNRSSISNLAMN